MKKVTLVIALLLVAFTASAQDMWSYAMQLTTAPEHDIESGLGTGWYVALMNGSTELASTSVAANNAGDLYVLGWNTPAITEGLDVFYRIYNDTVVPSEPYWQIDSGIANLQDLEGGFLPGANNVTLDFTGSEWVAVPEPASIMLLSLGGGLTWILRRRQKLA